MSLVNTVNLTEFFREKVNHSVHHVRVCVSPDVEYYLVNLLTAFSKSEHLFEYDEKGNTTDRALALRLLDALLSTRHARISILKKMGDIALYISGFFGESLFGKLVNLDYYINMGHTAYASLSTHLTQGAPPLKQLFGELAENFPKLVDVLSCVAESMGGKTDQNLLRLYEKWLATGSERTREILTQAGIVLTEGAKYAQ